MPRTNMPRTVEQVQDFTAPAAQPEGNQDAFRNEWADRFGILVGGFRQHQWNLIGDQSIGHYIIERRVWMTFRRLRVGRRPDFDRALDLPENAIQKNWSEQSERLTYKSPRECALDVINAFGEQGFCVPQVLIGHSDPERLCEKVWPRELRNSRRLFEHIQYFEGFQTDNKDEAGLASELLTAAYNSRGFAEQYIANLRREIADEK